MQTWILKCLLCLIINCPGIKSTDGDAGEKAELLMSEEVRKYGYPIEIFKNVPTEDDYLLDVFRIPSGKSKNSQPKPVVLLMHGLGGNSGHFLILGPERGLAFLLADRNYDVWLGNARGTRYCRKHRKMDQDDEKFWEFSWHEIGVYDLPAIINLIRNVTKREQLSYIGLSQGGTVSYVLTSMRPEYNKNINLMISLTPAVYQGNSGPLLKSIATLEPILTPLLKVLGINKIPPEPTLTLAKLAVRTLCSRRGVFQDLCAEILFLVGGYDPFQLNKTIIPVLFEDTDYAATRQFMHYAQDVSSGKFRQFNFGPRENLRRYGSPEPPSYNLQNVVTPVALFYGEGDGLVNQKDVARLSRELPNCVYNYTVPFKYFSHFDFVTANDVVELVYENIFSLLDKYNK